MKLTIILFLFTSTFTFSQDYGKEIQRIVQEFSDMNSYEIKAVVSVSGDEDFSFASSVKASKYGSHTITDQTEILVNKKYMIAIDHEEKTIRVDKSNYKVKSKGKSELGIDMLDQEVNEQGSVEFLGSTDEYRTYVIYHNSSISKTVVKIDNKTNFFHEIEVFYDSEEVSISSYKVNYTTFNRTPKFKMSDFDERLFIKQNGQGELTTTLPFTGYRLIKQF